DWVLILGSIAGLSQEQLKNVLRHRLGSAGFVKLAESRPADVVALLDDEYDLIQRVTAERHRAWSYGDVLYERVASRSRAGRAIGRGRHLEAEAEAVVSRLGRAGRTAPCDLAIPAGGDGALIVSAVKGFDSTGSKLTDAVREIEAMADVRRPRQFV